MELCGYTAQDMFCANVVPTKEGKPGRAMHMLKRLVKNHFYVKHRGQIPGQGEKQWVIKRFSTKNAKTHEFDVRDKETGKLTTMNVFQYYQKKYNIRIDKWMLPLLETQKRDVLFPLELALMSPAQRYPYKLNEAQVRDNPNHSEH